MIEINLLPSELKPANTTPKPRFATIIVGVILLTGLLTWYIKMTNLDIPTIKRNTTTATQEITLRQPELKEYDSLKSQKKRFTLRRTTVQNLIESRVPLEKLHDEICSILSSTDIWLKSLVIKKPTAGRGRRGARSSTQKSKGTPVLEITMDCQIQATTDVHLQRVAEFIDSFKLNPYFAENFILPTFTGVTLTDTGGTFKIKTTLIKSTKQKKGRGGTRR